MEGAGYERSILLISTREKTSSKPRSKCGGSGKVSLVVTRVVGW